MISSIVQFAEKKRSKKAQDFLNQLKSKKKTKGKNGRNPFVSFLLVVLLITALYQVFGTSLLQNEAKREEVAISDIITLYNQNKLESVLLKTGEVYADLREGEVFEIASAKQVNGILDTAKNAAEDLQNNQKTEKLAIQAVKLKAFKLPNETATSLGFNNTKISTEVSVVDVEADAFWGDLIGSILPIILIIAVFMFFMRKAGGGAGGGAFGFGSSKAKLFNKEDSTTKFADVAGADEAKEELVEVVDFLKHPEKYTKMGAKIPKGILLVGSPGTGKTLLARAVAGEADVPFFSISGSEFIEMFVGVGASRVRDLFDKAKKVAPAIIFIDEIDAIGKQRGQGMGGGHDEREQTLNQILTEMDGFENDTSVIILAATNRPEVLDKALLRPGRFDRRVVIDKPDVKARQEILEVHMKNKKVAKDSKKKDEIIDLESIAKKTPGFSGAELESVLNEAAIAAAKADQKFITQTNLFEAVEKVMMGPEKRSAKYVEKEKIITAYHEVGHALVSHKIPECDPVHKISIIARGMSLGSTWYLPDEEKRMYSKTKFLAEICSLLGGRIAEKTKFGADEITTGASNDLQRATAIARRMVTEYGMTDVGLAVLEEHGGSYTGSDYVVQKSYSEEKALIVDKEVDRILNSCLERAEKIIQDNLEIFEKIAQALLENEILTSDEFEAFFKN